MKDGIFKENGLKAVSRMSAKLRSYFLNALRLVRKVRRRAGASPLV